MGPDLADEITMIRGIDQQHAHKSFLDSAGNMQGLIEHAVDRSPEAVFFVESNARFVYVNHSACRSLGYTREELLGMCVFDIDLDFGEDKWKQFWQGIKTASVAVVESRLRRKDGSVFPVEIRTSYLEFDGLALCCAYARDISNRKLARDERGSLLTKMQGQLARLDAMREIALAITATLDLSAVLDTLFDKIDLLPYPAATIRLFDSETGQLNCVRCHNLNEAEWQADSESLQRGLTKIVFETGEVVVSEDVRVDPRTVNPQLVTKHGLVSFLGLPLVVRGNRLGVLSFFTKRRHEFTPDEIEFLGLIGAQAAVAIYNSQLYEQTKYNTARLGDANQQLAALYEITSTASQSLDLDSVLQQVIRKITEIFQFDTTRVFLFDGDMAVLRLRASFEREAELWVRIQSFRKGEGIVGRVAASGEAVVYEDANTDPRYSAASQTKNVLTTRHSFFAVFPIKSRSQIWGTIVCIGRQPRKLTSDEFQLITSMANQIGIAVENANLFEETRGRADQLSTLYALATVLNQTLDLEGMLRGAMHEILEIFAFEAGRIYLLNEDGQTLELLLQEGFPEELQVPPRYRPGEGVVGNVFESGVPRFFEDVNKDSIFSDRVRHQVLLRAGYICQFFIPIRVKGQSVGVINIVSKEIHPFSERETQLMDAIANQVGVAVENSSLFRQVQRRSNELDALAKINRDIAALLDRDALLPRIIKEAKELLKMDGGNFQLFEGEELVTRGSSQKAVVILREPFAQSGRADDQFSSKDRVLAMSSIADDPRLVESSRRALLESGSQSVLMAPLQVGYNVIGAINLLSHEQREFSADEMALMGSFAAQAAIAIQNANLFTEIREKARELEVLNIELQEANQVRTEFVNAMSHELRTPLTATIGYIGLLLDGYGGDLSKVQAETLENVSHQSGLLLKLISDILTLGQLEAGKTGLDVSEATLDEMLRHVQAYAGQLDQQRVPDMVWEIEEDLPPLKTDYVKLEEILQNLIANAYKFTVEGRVTVRVRNLPAEGCIEFVVEDTGIGIDASEMNRVFDAFHQSAEAHKGNLGGVGLGLSIVKKYLDLMEGRIHVESSPGQGAAFIFTLPYTLSSG